MNESEATSEATPPHLSWLLARHGGSHVDGGSPSAEGRRGHVGRKRWSGEHHAGLGAGVGRWRGGGGGGGGRVGLGGGRGGVGGGAEARRGGLGPAGGGGCGGGGGGARGHGGGVLADLLHEIPHEVGGEGAWRGAGSVRITRQEQEAERAARRATNTRDVYGVLHDETYLKCIVPNVPGCPGICCPAAAGLAPEPAHTHTHTHAHTHAHTHTHTHAR